MAPIPETPLSHGSHATSNQPYAASPASTALVAVPRIEAQPWVKGLVRWLSDHTSGVARVDLRRPTWVVGLESCVAEDA